jgi:hypothetical protein
VRLRRAGDATGSGRGPSAPSSALVGQLTRSIRFTGCGEVSGQLPRFTQGSVR